MAIEIIPTPKIEKTPTAKIILTIVLILFLIFLISYAILFFYHKKLKQESLELKEELEKTQAEKELEEELLGAKRLIEDWKLIAASHAEALGAFELLEKNTHPQVWFSDFRLNLAEGALEIKGQTENFRTLGQQILIFQNQEFIKETTLSDISISKEGKIIFGFQLGLDPKIFRSDLSK